MANIPTKNAPEYFGTQPAVLPKTLPAGTRTVYGNVAAIETRYQYGGYIVNGMYFHACSIEWSTTPIQETKRDTVPAPRAVSDDDGAPEVAELHRGSDNGASTARQSTCRSCSRPERPVMATVGELCVYCANRHGRGFDETGNLASLALAMTVFGDSQAARARNEAALAVEKSGPARNPKEAKMLALPHPWESWSTIGDES